MRADIFPAPRETDCGYGCCKAGDEGISSEVVRVGHTRLWRADWAELDYALADLRAAWWALVGPWCERLLRAILRHREGA
jgi:hypothetical protein